jgi:hypothetical protein
VSNSTRSASISRLIAKALPVCPWQFRQWQQWDEHEASRETRAHREEVLETLGDASLLVAKALAGKSKNRGRQRHALYLALDGRARPRAASSSPRSTNASMSRPPFNTR